MERHRLHTRGNTNTLSPSTLEKIKHMISEGALLKDMAGESSSRYDDDSKVGSQDDDDDMSHPKTMPLRGW